MKKIKTIDFLMYLVVFMCGTVGIPVKLVVGGQLYGIRARALYVGLVIGTVAWAWLTRHIAVFFANPQIFNAYAISRGRMCTGLKAVDMFINTFYYVIGVIAANSLPILCGIIVEATYCEGTYGFEPDVFLWMCTIGIMHFLILFLHYLGQWMDMYIDCAYVEHQQYR